MKRLKFFLSGAALAALIAAMPASAAKYVAVVETELDARSGASADLSAAEVALITAELRREAVKNLPQDKYSVMTSETVQSMGGAVLEECSDENCVVTLGSKIGADYIVRGIVSKFKTRLTLSVEMYETDNGTLVASSDPVRSENAAELLEKAAAACSEMYKTFAASQRTAPAADAAPPPETPGRETAAADYKAAPERKPEKPKKTAPAKEPKPRPERKPEPEPQTPPERRPMTGFSLGFNFHPSEYGHAAAQLGIAHSRPILEMPLSLNVEANILTGSAINYGGFFGFNVPVTALLQWHFISFEAGVDADLLFGDEVTLFNAGYVAGAGVGFSKKQSRRYFYRYCGGYNFGAHVIGMRWLF